MTRLTTAQTVALLLVFAGYWASGALAMALTSDDHIVSAIWPPAGIALAAVLSLGPIALLPVFVAELLVYAGELQLSSSLWSERGLAALVATAGAALQAQLGALLIQRVGGFRGSLLDARRIALFLLLGGPLASTINATIGTASWAAAGHTGHLSPWLYWLTWWLGDSSGVLLFAPLTLALLGEPRRQWRPLRAVVGLPLLLTAALVALTHQQQLQWDHRHSQDRFQQYVDAIADQLQLSLGQQQAVVQATAGFFANSEIVTLAEFSRYAGEQLRYHQDINQLLWIAKVEHADRERFEREQQQRQPGFAIREPGREVAAARAQYLPLVYYHPQAYSAGHIGLDLAAIPAFRQALEAALAKPLPSLSEPLPSYKTGAASSVLISAATHTDDRGGVVTAVLRPQQLLTRILAELDLGGISVELSDADADNALLYSSPGLNVGADSRFQHQALIEAGGRQWQLNTRGLPLEFAQHSAQQRALTLIATTLLSFMVSLFLLHRAAYTRQVEIAVAQRTRSLQYRASHDDVTRLANRSALLDQLQKLLNDARLNGREHALLWLGVDHFRILNETCGYRAGDALLRQLGGMIRLLSPRGACCARISGDQFSIALRNCNLPAAAVIADDLRRQLMHTPFQWEGQKFELSISAGVAALRRDSGSAEDVLLDAETACGIAKDSGRNQVKMYQPNSSELRQRREQMQMATEIQRAIEQRRFALYSQVIVPLQQDDQRRHCELLLRLCDSRGKVLPPARFLGAAERFGMMSALDRWVVDSALAFIASLPPAEQRRRVFNINLSGHAFDQAALLATIRDAIDSRRVPASSLCFEVTETIAIRNFTAAAHFIHNLREQGCHFALDDFGTGVNSLANLSRLPFDKVKIDGSFIRDIATNDFHRSVVKSTVELAHALGMKTVAEWVEDQQLAVLLRELGVDYGQGFAFGKPEPLTMAATTSEAGGAA